MNLTGGVLIFNPPFSTISGSERHREAKISTLARSQKQTSPACGVAAFTKLLVTGDLSFKHSSRSRSSRSRHFPVLDSIDPTNRCKGQYVTCRTAGNPAIRQSVSAIT